MGSSTSHSGFQKSSTKNANNFIGFAGCRCVGSCHRVREYCKPAAIAINRARKRNSSSRRARCGTATACAPTSNGKHVAQPDGRRARRVLAAWSIRLISPLVPLQVTFSKFSDISVDKRILLFSFGLSTVTGIVFGLVPALKTARVNLTIP